MNMVDSESRSASQRDLFCNTLCTAQFNPAYPTLQALLYEELKLGFFSLGDVTPGPKAKTWSSETYGV